MPDSRPKVSIGLPVYNGAEFLSQTLDGLVRQTLENLEIIISDNASTDETEAISRQYEREDSRIRYHRNAENLGLVRNFRWAREQASGEYFKWIAGDDVLEPTYLSRCCAALDASLDVVVSTSRMPFVDEQGQPIPYDAERGYITEYGEPLHWIEAPENLESGLPSERFREVVFTIRGNLFAQCYYGLIRKSALDQIPPLDFYLGAEKVFLAELSLLGKFHHITEDLMYRRMHPAHFGGQSLRKTATGLDPQWSGRVAFPVAKQLAGYARAVARADIATTEKARCFTVLGRKVLAPASLTKLIPARAGSYVGVRTRSEAQD